MAADLGFCGVVLDHLVVLGESLVGLVASPRLGFLGFVVVGLTFDRSFGAFLATTTVEPWCLLLLCGFGLEEVSDCVCAFVGGDAL